MRRITPLLIALAFAVVGFDPSAAQQRNPTSRPADITKNGALVLIRSAIVALDQANKTGNYTVLRDLGSPQFQTANSPARLAEIFSNDRRGNLDLSGTVVIEPQLNGLPMIEPNGMMRLVGFFPSVPQQINFEMLFAPVAGQWKLFGIGLTTGASTPVAPLVTSNAATPQPAPAQENAALKAADSKAVPPQQKVRRAAQKRNPSAKATTSNGAATDQD